METIVVLRKSLVFLIVLGVALPVTFLLVTHELTSDTYIHRQVVSYRINAIRDALLQGTNIANNRASLQEALRSPYAFERMCAIVAVRNLRDRGCFSANEVVGALDDPVRIVRREAASAIIDLGPCAASAAPKLARNLVTENGDIAAFSAEALTRIGPAGEVFLQNLEVAANSPDILLRESARDAVNDLTNRTRHP